MAKQRMRLTDASVARLRAAAAEYTVWDTRMAGFGVRVRPTGHRAYVYHDTRSGSSRRYTLGSVALMGVDEARRKCLVLQVQSSWKKTAMAVATAHAPRFADFVAGEWRVACLERYKPSTRRGVESTLASQLLPVFGALRLDRVTRIAVNRWFDKYSATAPGGANYAMKVLRQIMNHAIARGHTRTNPTRGVKSNPRPKLTRFLSRDEIRRLHEALDECVTERPSRAAGADIIRLLLLTGCRRSEILNLRWREVNGDGVDLSDAKTGPRRVFLNAQARAIVERQPRTASRYVFPSASDPSRPRWSRELPLWKLVRERAGLDDVRLHDLRHTFASQAVMSSIPVPTVARLLGHSQVRMTLRYAHVHDKEVEAAAERVGKAIARICGVPVS